MHLFSSIMCSLLVITGLQVSVESTGVRSERNTDRPYTSELSVKNGGGWGTWGVRDMCPPGIQSIAGFNQRFIKWCSSGFLTAFELRVESSQEAGDDTAANNIYVQCVQGVEYLVGPRTSWGYWGDMSQTCQGKGICGIKTRVEAPQGLGDDTALNDVLMYCCS